VTEHAVRELTTSLVRALRRIGDLGDPETANRLAGTAYAHIRRDEPLAAERLNGVMHYLARLEAAGAATRRSDPMTTDSRLDVREEPPARRHSLIFETFDALGPGDGFELVNDHDPKPLYYQFAAEHAGGFSWDYLEQGPVVWRVRIGRTGGPIASS
jgi:uncharacterized protein (DUF2249 family)